MSDETEKLINYKEFLVRSERPPIEAEIWKWDDLAVELEQAKQADPLEPGRWAVSLVNRSAGDAHGVCPGINMLVQVFAPGTHAKRHRHSNYAIFIVKEGRGYSIIDGRTIEWQAGDVFFAPPWAQHEHCNSSEQENAVLYTVQNVPSVASEGTWFFQGSDGTGVKRNLKG